MPRISLIGKSLEPYARDLRFAGHEVKSYSTSEALVKSLAAKAWQPSLVIINRSLSGGIRELKKALKALPKIIVSMQGDSRARVSWIREPYAHMADTPLPRDLTAMAARVISETDEMVMGKKLNRTIDAMKAELSFFDDIYGIMLEAGEINDIMPAVMKQATRITGAQSWSVYLVSEETGEQSRAKASGSLNKICASSISTIVEKNLNTNTPVLVKDIAKDKRLCKSASPECRGKGVSIIGAPIVNIINNKAIGSMVLLKKHLPFSSEDLDFLNKLAGRTAFAIERTSLQHRLEELAVTDDLTSLFNNRYLNRSVENEIRRSRRYGYSVSAIFMDVDHFKNVNDTHGHLMGSKVLVEMAEILIRELRNIDIVARYGGDEFVIILPQTSLNNAIAIAERIREAIEKYTFLAPEQLSLRLTASFGVASYPETAHSKEDMMRIADESMYNVKRNKRNGVYAIIH